MAAAFKFRLESALRLRHLQAEQERAKLQELVGRQKRLMKALADLWQERASASEFVSSSKEPAAQDLRALALFSLGVKARAQRIEQAIVDMKRQVTEQQARLLAAEREERSLEKLREKQHSEWNVKVTREIEASSQELWLATRTNNSDGRSSGSSTYDGD